MQGCWSKRTMSQGTIKSLSLPLFILYNPNPKSSTPLWMHFPIYIYILIIFLFFFFLIQFHSIIQFHFPNPNPNQGTIDFFFFNLNLYQSFNQLSTPLWFHFPIFCSFITLTLTLIALHNIPRSLWAHNLLLKGTQTEMGNTSDGDSLCNQYLVRLLYQCYT